MWLRAIVIVLAATASFPSASAGQAATIVTLAGVESTSVAAPAPCWSAEFCSVPARWPSTWVAVGRRAVGRIGPDGAVISRVPAPEGWSLGTAVAAMPDGSAWVTANRDGPTGFAGVGVLRVGGDASVSIVRAVVPVAGIDTFTSDPFDDLVALPNGSALVAIQGERRVLELDPTGRVRRAKDVGTVTSVAAGPGGRVLVGAEGGLLVPKLHLIRRLVQEWGSLAVNALEIFRCDRRSRRTFRCHWEDWAEGTALGQGRATFSLTRDGLIRVTLEHTENGRTTALFYEPRRR